MNATVKDVSEYWNKDKTRVATVMTYETRYLVQCSCTEGRTELVEFDNLKEAESKASEWING